MSNTSHIDALINLRATLIEKRRSCANKARAEELLEIVAQIEAIDKSIVDERKLAEVL